MIFHIAVNSCQLFGQLDIDISTRYNAAFFRVCTLDDELSIRGVKGKVVAC